MSEIRKSQKGIYARYIKRIMDICCALATFLVFGWLYLILAVLIRVKLGSPVIFKQKRPGKDERIFTLYKFRTMTEEKDENGNLLSDDERLTPFGKWLRDTSLDEIPEAFNILKGDMSIIGPRPQLVRDMVFMTDEQRRRHSVRPGLSGWAQVNGRNSVTWDEKLTYDLEYIDAGITFKNDVKIIFMTVMKVFIKPNEVSEGETGTVEDYGDYLLLEGRVEREVYEQKQLDALRLLGEEVTE